MVIVILELPSINVNVVKPILLIPTVYPPLACFFSGIEYGISDGTVSDGTI
jgi:hypothetical protein